MNAHNHPRRETVSEWRTRLCAEQDAERRRTNPELAAHLDAIPFGKVEPVDYLGKILDWMAHQPNSLIVHEGEVIKQPTLRKVLVLDPDTDTNGFVLFPMTGERGGGLGL